MKNARYILLAFLSGIENGAMTTQLAIPINTAPDTMHFKLIHIWRQLHNAKQCCYKAGFPWKRRNIDSLLDAYPYKVNCKTRLLWDILPDRSGSHRIFT